MSGAGDPIRGAALGPDPLAVVEIGSGSAKLLITDADALARSGPDPIRWAVKTRLWAGSGGSLDPAGLAATAEAVDGFATVIDQAEVSRLVAVGTAAAREAADADQLGRICRDRLGVELEVLDGTREAELGFVGATAGRNLPGPLSLIDIGAGSTELATSDGEAIRSWSLPIGARVLTDAYLQGDPPRADELSSALSVAELHYDDLRRHLPELGAALAGGTLVGVGAVGQIAAVEVGHPDPTESVDGHHLPKRGVEEVFRTLATETAEDRAWNPGLLPEHVDDIVGALCVLVEFLRRYDVAELVVSERDLRHGRAAEELATN